MTNDQILEKHFNIGMKGVRTPYRMPDGSKVLLTYSQWKKDYPSLYAVIMKSMEEVKLNERQE